MHAKLKLEQIDTIPIDLMGKTKITSILSHFVTLRDVVTIEWASVRHKEWRSFHTPLTGDASDGTVVGQRRKIGNPERFKER